MKISEEQKCLIGVCLQFFGQGFLFIWGKCNIYYYSYYKLKDPSLPYSYNYIIALFLALPVFILSIIALPIAKYFGFRLVIITMAFLQLIFTILSSQMPNYPLFLFFYAFLNGMIYILQYYPSLKCLWSHYLHNEGKVLGIAFGVFNASVFTFILFTTYLINPNDEEASLQITEGNQTFYYFDEKVAKNVPKTVLLLGIITGCFNIIGSSMINFNQGAIQKKPEKDKISEIELQENIKFPTQISLIKQEDGEQTLTRNQLFEIIRTKQFLIFFFNKFSLMLYMIIFGINFKQYSLTKVNDDYFITYVENSSMLISSLTNILIGFLVDRVNYKKFFLIMFFNLGIIGILFPVISNHGQYYFALSRELLILFNLGLLFLNILDVGTIILIPPGLMKIYTQEIGIIIYPYINTGAKIALLLGPIIQMVGLRLLDLDQLLMLCGCAITFTSLSIVFLEMEYHQKE